MAMKFPITISNTSSLLIMNVRILQRNPGHLRKRLMKLLRRKLVSWKYTISTFHLVIMNGSSIFLRRLLSTMDRRASSIWLRNFEREHCLMCQLVLVMIHCRGYLASCGRIRDRREWIDHTSETSGIKKTVLKRTNIELSKDGKENPRIIINK